jgi:hypothetical protein
MLNLHVTSSNLLLIANKKYLKFSKVVKSEAFCELVGEYNNFNN